MRKIFTLCLGVLLSVFSMNQVFAYSGGDGSAGNPYQIATAADLVALSNTTADWGMHFILTDDIDMAGETFTPIGYGVNVFSGSIDGDMHVIENLTVSTTATHLDGTPAGKNAGMGLIGKSWGDVKDLGIINIQIDCNVNRVAAFVGDLVGGSITNCFSEGGRIKAGGWAGSFVGATWAAATSSLTNCYSSTEIVAGWGHSGLVGDIKTSFAVNNVVYVGITSGEAIARGNGARTNAYYSSSNASGAGTGLSDVELADPVNYVGLDFTNTWMMTGGKAVLKFPYFIKYSGGAGTAADPFQLSTAEDIVKLSGTQADWNAGYHFQVTTDIDMAGQDISPIGYKNTANVLVPFKGTFDGNNKKISNLSVTPHADQNGIAVGMFGIVTATTIQNLGLHDVSIDALTTQERVGGIVGQIDGGGSSITNCYVLGGSISGKGRVGGIVGYCASSSISNCFTKVDIENSWGSGGGIVGQLGDSWASGASIDDVVFYGTITGGGNAIVKISVNGASPTVGEGYYIESVGVEDANATKLTKLEMVKQASYPALNFSGTWAMKSGGYAYLSSFPADNFATLLYDGPNITPVADAGVDQTVNEMTQVTLNGKITDESNDGPSVSYMWTAPDGIELSDEAIANPTFTAPGTKTGDVYTLTLVVNDGIIDSEPSEVKITVNNVQNYAPVANDVTVFGIGEAKVTLGLEGIMDPDGDALTYKWTAPAGITLKNATSAHPYFESPEVTSPQTLTFTVEVTDGDGLKDTATITVALDVPPVPVSPYAIAVVFLLVGVVTLRKKLF